MALTRKFLAALGIENDKIDEIISAHTDTVNGLKDEIEKHRSSADRLADAQRELGEQKDEVARLKKLVSDNEKSPYKKSFEELDTKYKDLEKQFSDYKADIEAKDVLAKKTDAYKKLLVSSGVSDKRIDAVMRVSDIGAIEFNEDGTVKDAEKLTENIKSEWSDFIVSTHEQGAKTPNPPEGNDGGGNKPSLAAKLAQQYHANLYGSSKED